MRESPILMKPDLTTMNIVHNPDEKRFEVALGEDIAVVEYMLAGRNMIFTHTEVPEAFEGYGVASRMAEVALEHARDEGYLIQALCPFIARYVKQHPEYHDITWGYF